MSDPEVLVIALDLMAKSGIEPSVFASIVKRNNLVDRGILKSPELIRKSQLPGLPYVENILFAKDAFCPTETFFTPPVLSNAPPKE